MLNCLAGVMLAMAIAAPALAQPKALVIDDSVQTAAARSVPQVGDHWTYLLTTQHRRRAPEKSSVVVRITASSSTKILDEVSHDGAAPTEWTHFAGSHMVEQVVSVFSPYLVVFEDLKPGDRISNVTEHDDDCFGWLRCWTAGRVEGHETLELAAGRFSTIKVTIEQNVQKRIQGARLSTRTLTIWYSPQAKRVVKVTSRVSRGLTTTFHASFDLELLSYHLTAPQPLDRTQVLAPKEAAGSEPRHALVGNGADVKGAQATATRGLPRVGDTWTYRLTDRRGGKKPVESSYVVKVKATPGTKVVDEVSRDGAAPVEHTHSAGKYMVEEVVPVFSPYLLVFEDLKSGDRIWRVSEHDGCSVKCWTVGRVEGRETLRVAAGKFDTIKVRLDQSRQIEGLPREPRHRFLTIWYSPQAKRAVKFTIRSSGDDYEIFDIELSSYQLQ